MKKLIENRFVLVILCLSLVTSLLMVINIINVSRTGLGNGDTVGVNTGGLLDNGVYSLPNNPTDLQKDLYEELSEALDGYTYDESESSDQPYNEDSQRVAELVVKNFVADFYTWTNKSSSYDVGGVTYFPSTSYLIAQEHARNTFYKDLDGYIEQYGRENLIEVSEVSLPAVAPAKDFPYDGNEYRTFYVMANWTYKDSTAIDVHAFQRGAEFQVSYIDDHWQIVQFWGIEVD